MSWDFVCWLFAFVLNSGLLGKCMFTVISLLDLENDNINPFDCADQVNRFVPLEYAVQALLTCVLLLANKWFVGAVHLMMCALMVHLYIRKQVYMQAADAFKQLKAFKQRKYVVFGIYLTSFVFLMYRLIESGLHTMLTPEGRQVAKKLFKEAGASLHHY